MAHREPDRPPIDLGATSLTGMRPGCQRRLLDLLGLPGEPRVSNSGVDERILEWAGTDFRSVGAIVDLPSVHTARVSDTCFVDCWGCWREFVQSEWQIFEPPLREASREDLGRYPWPTPRIDDALLAGWEARARELARDGEYVVVAEHPVFGILELGCWMCGYDEFLFRLAADPDFVRSFFDRVLAIQLEVIEVYYRTLGPYVQLTTSGDDFGTQAGPFVSPAMFEDLIAPYFSARIARTKELAHCDYWHHSCGSVTRLLPQIIGCGVDILNPVQTSAVDMAPERLKSEFGDTLVFWGAVDVQQFLPRATPDQVRTGVRDLIRTLGRQGGYVVAPAHEMQDDVPAENVAAMIEAARG
jgi:uroporphyrinogen decarboxylase